MIDVVFNRDSLNESIHTTDSAVRMHISKRICPGSNQSSQSKEVKDVDDLSTTMKRPQRVLPRHGLSRTYDAAALTLTQLCILSLSASSTMSPRLFSSRIALGLSHRCFSRRLYSNTPQYVRFSNDKRPPNFFSSRTWPIKVGAGFAVLGGVYYVSQ